MLEQLTTKRTRLCRKSVITKTFPSATRTLVTSLSVTRDEIRTTIGMSTTISLSISMAKSVYATTSWLG